METTSLIKKFIYGQNRATKLGLGFSILLIVGVLYPNWVLGAFPFEDSFNYQVGTFLKDTAEWDRVGGTGELEITDVGCADEKCVIGNSSYAYHQRIGTSIFDDGQWTWYWYVPTGFTPTTYVYLMSNPPTPHTLAMISITSSDNPFLITLNAFTLDYANRDEWFSITCEWKDLDQPTKADRKVRCKLNDNSFTDWIEVWDGTSTTGRNMGSMMLFEGGLPPYQESVRFDHIGNPLPPPTSNLNITDPISGSEEISNFTMSIDYDKMSENWDKIMILFESWNEASSCPVYDTPEFWEEYNNGWFNYQSLPFFSPILITETGSTTIGVSNLDLYSYNCVRCYFILENVNMSDEKCEDYILTITDFIPPAPPLPFPQWIDYYNTHKGENFDEPTGIFNTIASVIDNLIQRLGSFVNNFKNIFDNTQAEAKGNELGQKIPLARGYLAPINTFFGGLPISELFILCILIAMIMIIYRIIKTILTLIRG